MKVDTRSGPRASYSLLCVVFRTMALVTHPAIHAAIAITKNSAWAWEVCVLILLREAAKQFLHGIALGHPWQKTVFLFLHPCPYRQASFFVAKEELRLSCEEVLDGGPLSFRLLIRFCLFKEKILSPMKNKNVNPFLIRVRFYSYSACTAFANEFNC